MKKILSLLLLLLPLCVISQNQTDMRSSKKKIPIVYSFTIDEEIAPPATKRVELAMEEARKVDAELVVVTINTFGGRLDDADKIRTIFLESPIPIYAFIDNNAASAGALISIACDSIYMHSGSSIGSATVVDQAGEVQPDKYQSYMRSLMRTTAESRGRRPDIAEAMVDPDLYVAGISDSGKVLAFTTQEAIKYHYCEAECESVREVLHHAGIDQYDIHEQRYTLIQKVVGFLISPVVSGILIMLIVGGIYFELHSPGIGFPLATAVLGALLYFAPLYLEGLAANWEILVFIVGVALIAVELFVIPGFGIAGISGIICVLAGLSFSMISNEGFDFTAVPTASISESILTVMLSIIVAIPLCIYLAKKLFESSLFGGLAQNTELTAENGYTISDTQTSHLVGAQGVTLTILRPSGKVTINGRVYDAVSEISFVEKGCTVRVVRYEGNTLHVLPL